MILDFPLILLSVVVFTGAVALCDFIFCICKGEPLLEKKKRPLVIEYARAFFPVLLAVFLIRSFVAQPYRVPTGSLEPTVIPGDFIFVNQFQYGLRFPVWNKKIMSVSEPKRGQIALFYYPVNHAVTFVKRVIGLPGDHISYINKTLYINGKEQKQKYLGTVTRLDDFGQLNTYQKYQEDLMGVKHDIFVRPDMPAHNFYNVVVPKDDYFMMGDNRDDSDDSRYWGPVQRNDFIGRAEFIWMSWKANSAHWYDHIRWDRIGKKL
ncbi:MAG: signal peptidase I [Gammaproteobacteria bacterium CG_4_10_14_0_8_um_filter_38_16]|nr:MAG: signal peptidase I [Gammaproteobacteria bacterium CG_4_10_14_0_8_um_filter_38_16]PJA03130.1 MAG: signal peptidase I [Gammaproteobacteria bacterium CG_4_10_14_0_2_um_filter_38_22]PJB09940.1 MAG: signal peptidase I [Gammaproteobacteria bacterium CG_4_9_14_3_um_filter_38_9]